MKDKVEKILVKFLCKKCLFCNDDEFVKELDATITSISALLQGEGKLKKSGRNILKLKKLIKSKRNKYWTLCDGYMEE